MLFRFGISAAVMLATCGAATAQVKVRIGDLAQSLNEIGSRTMIDQGIDKKYGIAAEYQAYPTLDGLFTAIRGKDVDVGFGGWTAIAQFRSKGFPVTMIFPVGRGVTVDPVPDADSAATDAAPAGDGAECAGRNSACATVANPSRTTDAPTTNEVFITRVPRRIQVLSTRYASVPLENLRSLQVRG
jgi:hypothetical protein